MLKRNYLPNKTSSPIQVPNKSQETSISECPPTSHNKCNRKSQISYSSPSNHPHTQKETANERTPSIRNEFGESFNPRLCNNFYSFSISFRRQSSRSHPILCNIQILILHINAMSSCITPMEFLSLQL